MFRSHLKFSFFCALAGLAANPVSTYAASTGFDQTPPTRVVSFADLDLTRDAGVQKLYSRIRSAAREVCEPSNEVSIKLLRQQYDCRQDAVARAIAEVNSPGLTNFYVEKTKSKNLAANQAQ